MANQSCKNQMGSTRGIGTHPNLVESLYGGNGAEKNTVDGGGDLRRGRTGDDGDDPKTRATAAGDLGAKRFEELNRALPSVYISPCCRWDRVEKLGDTEMDNCCAVTHIGHAEIYNSVSPR